MGTVKNVHNRIVNKYRRFLGDHFACETFNRADSVSYISFSFDDFTHSAFSNGARILEKYGLLGTFYISMGLLNAETPSGKIASIGDIDHLLRSGHEIGCHTFNHDEGWATQPQTMEESVIQNQNAFRKIYPHTRLRSFAYPIHGPKPKTKEIVGKRFLCCRGGGQTFNSQELDLNLLKAYFLDWRNHNDMKAVAQLIENNILAGGWLIFATHDVSDEPSKYGCSTTFFHNIVRFAVESDAIILNVVKTCTKIGVEKIKK